MNARREQLDRSPTEAFPDVGFTHEGEHLARTSPCLLRGRLALPLRAISPNAKMD